MFSQSQSLNLIAKEKTKRESSCTITNLSVSIIDSKNIIFTENIPYLQSPWKFPDIPICVVPFKNGKYLIADGNHRFKADIQNGEKQIRTWILRSINKRSVQDSQRGKMAGWLHLWKIGQISYRELKKRMIIRAREIGSIS
jgi:hypothetical protein